MKLRPKPNYQETLKTVKIPHKNFDEIYKIASSLQERLVRAERRILSAERNWESTVSREQALSSVIVHLDLRLKKLEDFMIELDLKLRQVLKA